MTTAYKALKYIDKRYKDKYGSLEAHRMTEHCASVYFILKELAPEDEKLHIAALLHDILEDTDVTYEELVKEFGKEVADLVHEVTHEGTKDSKGYYFPRLHSKRGIMLKFADRLHNLSRIDDWTVDRQEQYLRRSKFWRSE